MPRTLALDESNRIRILFRSGYGYRNLENLGFRILMTNRPSTRLCCGTVLTPRFLM